MSIWTRISEAISALAKGEPLSQVFDRLRTPPERTVAFTIAVIALGAKMAKADGRVTRDEVAAFREVFHIRPEDEKPAARIFNMARTDVAGFEGYAERIARMFGPKSPALEDLLEGLFHIAAADGIYHPNEEAFLRRVWEIFGLSDRFYRSLRARYSPDAAPDPYEILGLDPEATDDEVRARRRELVRETHPDRLAARGVPEEAVKLTTKRLAAINEAYAEIARERGFRRNG